MNSRESFCATLQSLLDSLLERRYDENNRLEMVTEKPTQRWLDRKAIVILYNVGEIGEGRMVTFQIESRSRSYYTPVEADSRTAEALFERLELCETNKGIESSLGTLTRLYLFKRGATPIKVRLAFPEWERLVPCEL